MVPSSSAEQQTEQRCKGGAEQQWCGVQCRAAWMSCSSGAEQQWCIAVVRASVVPRAVSHTKAETDVCARNPALGKQVEIPRSLQHSGQKRNTAELTANRKATGLSHSSRHHNLPWVSRWSSHIPRGKQRDAQRTLVNGKTCLGKAGGVPTFPSVPSSIKC